MLQQPVIRYLILAVVLLLLVIASWKLLLPTNTPTAVAPPGANVRTADPR